MHSLREIKESTELALEFVKYILSIGDSGNFETKMHKKYNLKMTPHHFSSTNTYILIYNSYYQKFGMSYRYRTSNDSKFQSGISMNSTILEKGYTLLCSKFIRYNNKRIELIEDLDDTDLLSLSTLYTLEEVQAIYVLHELNKIPELYGVCLDPEFINFVNGMYIKVQVQI